MMTLIAAAALGMMGAGAPQKLPIGSWAGDRMIMVVTENGASLKSDCASGQITTPLAPSEDGRFTARGSFRTLHGGPDRADVAGSAQQATFSGRLDGDTLTLSVTEPNGATPRTFVLKRGATIKLIRCL